MSEKKKKKEKGVHSYYKIEEGKLVRLRPFCERCGPGYFCLLYTSPSPRD